MTDRVLVKVQMPIDGHRAVIERKMFVDQKRTDMLLYDRAKTHVAQVERDDYSALWDAMLAGHKGTPFIKAFVWGRWSAGAWRFDDIIEFAPYTEEW